MNALTCGICLEALKVPVSTPCGHLCCEACLTSYIEASADALNASCPTCRSSFSIAIPDLRFVPKKYHSLILPSIRRVFISPNVQLDTDAVEEAQHDLRAEIARLTHKIDALVQDKALLMDRCEASIRASQAHAEGERDERLAKERFERECRDLRKKYDSLKGKYRTLKTVHDDGSSASAQRLHMKRTSSQAALDGGLFSASSSTESLTLPTVREDGASEDTSSGGTGPRAILRIAKRPRLLGSPFDLSKRIESRRVPGAPRVRRIGHGSDYSFGHDEDDEDGDDEDGRSLTLRLSDLSSSASSSRSVGPQRSGLPMGDVFSPRRPVVLSYTARPGSTFNAGWLLSPEDA